MEEPQRDGIECFKKCENMTSILHIITKSGEDIISVILWNVAGEINDLRASLYYIPRITIV